MAGGPSAIEGRTIDVLRRQLAEARADRDEAQAQQAALAEVLQAINTASADFQPVFQMIIAKAMAFCDAAFGGLLSYDDGQLLLIAHVNGPPAIVEFWRTPQPLPPKSGAARALVDGTTSHIADAALTDAYVKRLPFAVASVELGGIRTMLQVPLMGERGPVGLFVLYRQEVRPFTDKQVALVQAFAGHAVLAMGNARLLTELRESESRHGLVTDAVAEGIYEWNIETNALWVSQRLTVIFGFEGRELKAADWNEIVHPEDYALYLGALRDCFRGTTRRLDCEYRVRHADGAYRWVEDRGVPVRDTAGRAVRMVGAITDVTARKESERALREALEQQTATAEILRVISQSPTDVQPVLAAVVRAACRFCGAPDAVVMLREGDEMVFAAHQGILTASLGERRPLRAAHLSGLAMIEGRTQQIGDVDAPDAIVPPESLALARQHKWRATAAAPMMRDGKAIGAVVLRKPEPGLLSPRQIELLEIFAAQAVIAIENVRLFTELRESLDQQTATSEVLRVISQSPTDVQRALDAVAAAARRFCGAADASITLREGEELLIAAHDGVIGGVVGQRDPFDRTTSRGLSIASGRTVHIPDLESAAGEPFKLARQIGRQFNFRAVLSTPLMRDNRAIGCLTLRRPEPGVFTPRQIQLLETFADQAVIAIENARLFTELTESLEQQTATADILRVISQSPTDVAPVLDAVAKAAQRFCGAKDVSIFLREGDKWLIAAHDGPIGAGIGERHPLNRETAPARAMLDARTIHLPDIPALDPVEYAAAQDFGRRLGFKAALAAPMLREGTTIGAISLRRAEPGAFTPRQIELLESFAAQAVIALENTRLFTELKESLEQQTATADILETINRAQGDLQPVFDAIVDKAMALCDAAFGMFNTYDGEHFNTVSTRGVPEAYAQYRAQNPPAYGPGTGPGRLLAGEDCVHEADSADSDVYRSGEPNRRAMVDLGGARTILNVALRKDSTLLGMIAIYRQEVRPFEDTQISLLQSFAAQAVIAMENARLLGELRESLERQTATSEVLQVINSSPGDVRPVFDEILVKAMTLCDAAFGTFATFDGERLNTVATRGVPEAFAQFRLSNPPAYGSGTGPARLIAGERYVHDIDAADSEAYRQGDPSRRAIVDLGGARTILNVALRKDDVLLGTISIYREEVRPFSDNQIALLQGFAAQAVIAMENARLLGELRESLDQQTATAEVLQVINASPGDLAPVFDAMLEKAMHLCGADFGNFTQYDGNLVYGVAYRGVSDEFINRTRTPFALHPGGEVEQAVKAGTVLQVVDMRETESYRAQSPGARFLVDIENARTVVWVPLLKDERSLGFMVMFRREVRPFTDKQIALLKDFAAQAVIAMENTRLLGELRESLEQQTATADVLSSINSSPGDLVPVFETILDKAHALCKVAHGSLQLYDGTSFRAVAVHSVPEPLSRRLREGYIPRPGMRQLVEGADFAHFPDMAKVDDPLAQATVDAGIRSLLTVALRKDGKLLGQIVAARKEVRPFADKEISLLQGFASQAVVAMENARLLGELTRREEELRVTFDHMGDGVVMFDADQKLAAWNRNFQELLDMPDDFLASRPARDDYVRLLAQRGELGDRDVDKEVARYRDRATRQWSAERTRPDGRVLEVRNNPVPGGGSVLIYSDITKRKQAEAEIRAARDAAEAALERQTATADILKVIASSPTDARPVLDAVAKAAVRFCGATDAIVHLRDSNDAVVSAHEGPLRGTLGRRRPIAAFPSFSATLLEGRTIHYPDVQGLDTTEFAALRQVGADVGFRAVLSAPLLREGMSIGSIGLRRAEPGPFTPQQIELLEAFAAQAVIAIENVRLFTELKEALEQQTATADILSVISRSPTDVQPVLEAVTRAALRFCGAPDAIVMLRDGDENVVAAHEGTLTATLGLRRPTMAGNFSGQAIFEGRTLQIADVDALDPAVHAGVLALARQHKWRASAAAPMMHSGKAIGCVVLRKPEPGLLSPRQIALLETFAAQAVIAIENVRLFTELRDSLERLKAAQANLVQSEKMASLGQLTAGIAHEIKNPLNFVNNFAGLSVELLDELKEVAGPALDTLDADKRAELDETMQLLVGNLQKITEHGKRADGIVKSMLSHSRGGSGDWTPSDINALVEEALNLAYHGARAQDKEFNVTLERDYVKESQPIEVVPQDVTRVFLNLFGNGFYAANKRRSAAKQAGFRPTLKVTTRDLGETVEVKVRDNGIGIPPEVREKLFQPFFTTKPTGEGTGLGLSISYDIVTQQHGGTIEVESEVGNFTEFTVRLPRARRVQPSERA